MSNCEINGEEPNITNRKLTDFRLLQFYDGLEISDQMNAAHFRFGADWVCLYFESGTVFWRASLEPPERPVNSTLKHGLLLNDLSEMDAVVGQVLESIQYSGNEVGDVQVSLHFLSGATLEFQHSATTDSSRVVIS